MPKLRHGSLFSGIGGFDLAAEWMGWENVFHCEWNDFGKKILKYYWPNAISYDDITKTDFTIHRGKIDILTGGFPCQPYSMAGKRKGKDDERHLWPEMLRAIKEISPRYIVGENVRGLTNWNGGMVFEEVCAQMEDIGYQVAPFLIPASGVGAPHRRERIWFVAYRSSREQRKEVGGRHEKTSQHGNTGHGGSWIVADADMSRCGQGNQENERRTSKQSDGNCFQSNAADADSFGLSNGKFETRKSTANNIESNSKISQYFWSNWPIVSPICHGDDGLSDRLDAITFPKWRQESIKGGGNAVVPQVVYQIFKTIDEYDRSTDPAAPDH